MGTMHTSTSTTATETTIRHNIGSSSLLQQNPEATRSAFQELTRKDLSWMSASTTSKEGQQDLSQIFSLRPPRPKPEPENHS
jgi:hypothetical protein